MRKIVAAVFLLVSLGVFAGVVSQKTSAPEIPCHEMRHGPEARECYKKLLKPSRTSEIESMFAKAGEMLQDPVMGGHFTVECHEVMHLLGTDVEADMGPINLETTPVETCMVGFQHGVAEYRLAGVDDTELVAQAPSWCDGQDLSICRHLIGHVGMRRALSASNKPDLSFAESVCSLPDDFSRPERDTRLNEFRCLEGAYMEWTLWAMRTDDSSVPYPAQNECIKVRERSIIASSACFSQVGTLMYGQYPDATSTLRACTGSLNDVGEHAVRMCLYSVVNVIVSFTEDPAKLGATLCRDDYRFECGVGFARSIAANSGDDQAGPACSAVLPEAVKECTASAIGPYPFEYESSRGSKTAPADPLDT